MAVTQEIVFAWPMGSWHGWGIRGFNTALHWPGTAVSAMVSENAELGEGDPRRELLARRLQQSRNFQDHILATGGPSVELEAPVLIALGNDLSPGPVAHGRWLKGRPTIACAVFEDLQQVEANVERLRAYDRVVVASRWNQDALGSLGVDALLCHEGIDPVLFNPLARRKRDDGRFRVFSGGKTEYRKGQDIVIDAFKLFAEKHDDAVLVCCWGSPFGWSGGDFEGKWKYGSPPGLHIGKPNYGAWLQRAGLKPHQYEIVSPLPNWRMPEVYGNVDVAVFPNRCEGGTNFVAMEAMACGVPTVIRGGSGQADLAEWGPAWMFSLNEADGLRGALELAYSGGLHRIQTPKKAEAWTWDRHCKQMAEIIGGV